MNYTEAVDYIETIPKFTVKHPPEHTRELLSRLGNPQEGIKIIHVAGTNGKGSVCAYLNAMLLAGGKKTGLFTSPHLVGNELECQGMSKTNDKGRGCKDRRFTTGRCMGNALSWGRDINSSACSEKRLTAES